MSGEDIAFSDVSDYAITFADELQVILQKHIPVHLFTDSKCLFDVIAKGSRTSEKRTMRDIAVAREAFKKNKISNIGFIRSSRNIADGLTKVMTQKHYNLFLVLAICSWKLNNGL